MIFQFLASLFRSLSPNLPFTPPALGARLHIDLRKSKSVESKSAGVAERNEGGAIAMFRSVLPEVAGISSGSVNALAPERLNSLVTLRCELEALPSFNWEHKGELSIKDEFNAHNVHYKRTFFNARRTKSEVTQRSVARSRQKIMQTAHEWLESFVSDADSAVFPRIQSSVNMGTIWEHLTHCINVAVAGQSEPLSPALEKEIQNPGRTVFLVIGAFEQEASVKIYSVRMTAWAEYNPELGHLRSGIKGEVKCMNYEVPALGDGQKTKH